LNPKHELKKEDFVKYLPKLDNNGYFAVYKPLSEEKIGAAETQKRSDEAKRRDKDEWTKKMVVDDPTLRVSLKPVGLHVLDKYKGLLTDEAKKASLKMPAKYIKDKVVKRDVKLETLPISYNLAEAKLSKYETEKLIRLNRDFDPKLAVSQFNFDTVKAKNDENFVHKPRRQDVFREM
jgi:hypothetical protein